jgi:glutamyl-tRNA synthetase
MVLRFDDTNPMNEKVEFVDNIKRDCNTLEIYPDEITHTSDYFADLVKYMEKMINGGHAYADNSTGEEMKA